MVITPLENGNQIHFLKRKAVSKKTKITETLKDIIFINDPDVCDVPRKSDRAFYYRSGLVALAVKFSSDMDLI